MVINPGVKVNHAFIVYESTKSVNELRQKWSIFIMKDAVKITPTDLTEIEMNDRSAYCLKLTGLLLHTYAKDLEPLLTKYKCKTCSIPRNLDNLPLQYAFINFESEADLIEATKAAEIDYSGRRLYWNPPDARTCHNCGNPNHLVRSCKYQRTEYPKRTGFLTQPGNNRFNRSNPYQQLTRATPRTQRQINRMLTQQNITHPIGHTQRHLLTN